MAAAVVDFEEAVVIDAEFVAAALVASELTDPVVSAATADFVEVAAADDGVLAAVFDTVVPVGELTILAEAIYTEVEVDGS